MRYRGDVTFAALALAADLSAGDCRTPQLRIKTASSSAKQGGIVAVTVTSDVPLSRVSLESGGRDLVMERDAAGRKFRALLGIDLESAIGPRAIGIQAEGLCGDTHAASGRVRVVSGRFPVEKLEVAPEYVEPPESELERIEADKEKVARVWASGRQARLWRRAFRPPIEAKLRNNFGSRRVFNGQPRSPHGGMDIAAAEGTPVTAPAPAIVALAESLYFSGGTVILDHGGGLFTTYFHLSRIDVKPGDSVATGNRIGAVGETGRATGPHLHWGAKVQTARVNPLDLLKLPNWPAAERRNNPTSQLN